MSFKTLTKPICSILKEFPEFERPTEKSFGALPPLLQVTAQPVELHFWTASLFLKVRKWFWTALFLPESRKYIELRFKVWDVISILLINGLLPCSSIPHRSFQDKLCVTIKPWFHNQYKVNVQVFNILAGKLMYNMYHCRFYSVRRK